VVVTADIPNLTGEPDRLMLKMATGLRLRTVLPTVAALGRTPCTKTGRATATRGPPSRVPGRIITGVTHLLISPPAGTTPDRIRTGVVAVRADAAQEAVGFPRAARLRATPGAVSSPLRGGGTIGVYGAPGLAGHATSSSCRAAVSSSSAVAFH